MLQQRGCPHLEFWIVCLLKVEKFPCQLRIDLMKSPHRSVGQQ